MFRPQIFVQSGTYKVPKGYRLSVQRIVVPLTTFDGSYTLNFDKNNSVEFPAPLGKEYNLQGPFVFLAENADLDAVIAAFDVTVILIGTELEDINSA